MKQLFFSGIALLILSTSCSREQISGEPGTVTVSFVQSGMPVKSADPDEERISDLTLFVFNREGLLETSLYFRKEDLYFPDAGRCSCEVNLLKDCRYTLYACANMGFRVLAGNLEELEDFCFHLAYPDDYRIGIPMSGIASDVTVPEDGSGITVPLTRAMAKVSVRIDRSRLSDGVEFNVTGMKVCGCPKSVRMFSGNSVKSEDDVFVVGFTKEGYDVQSLNRNVSGQTSGEASLYLFENLQGKPLGEIGGHGEKFFPEGDPMGWMCSYIEMYADYVSGEYRSVPGESLVYRFYLGESPSDFNVMRNCHYHITVTPEDDGLNGDGWRVDKSGLEYVGEKYLKVSPANYIHGHVGDIIRIRCDYKPGWAPFDIGIEELETDKANGIYDYRMDADGKGVTLTLKGSGGGLLYFEVGEPVNEAEMVVIVSDP